MKEPIIERTMKPLPAPFEEFEEFSTPMQEFFELVARRPFETENRVKLGTGAQGKRARAVFLFLNSSYA